MPSHFWRTVSVAMLLQLGFELCWLVAAVLLALRFAARLAMPIEGTYSLALVFALLIVCLNGVFGLYRRTENLSIRDYALRFVLAPAFGIPLAYMIAEVVPGGASFQEHVGAVALFALGGLVLVRHAIVLPLIRAVAPHRVLVLGDGTRGAARRSLAGDGGSDGHPPGGILRVGERRTGCRGVEASGQRGSTARGAWSGSSASTKSSLPFASSAMACFRYRHCSIAG